MMSVRMGGGAGTGDWGLGSVTRRTDRAIGSPSPAFGRGVGVRARLLAGNIKGRTLTRRFAPPSPAGGRGADVTCARTRGPSRRSPRQLRNRPERRNTTEKRRVGKECVRKCRYGG